MTAFLRYCAMHRFAIPAFLIASLALISADPQPAAKTPLSEPRQRLLKGNVAEARSGFETLLADAKHGPAAAIGIANTWRQNGSYDKARTACDDAVKRFPGNADVLAARGDLLYDLGQWDAALADAEAALKIQDDHMPARWVRARILRDSGKLDEADAEMRWFVRAYSAASNADKDISDPDLLLLVGQAGAENARWHNLNRQYSFIINEVYNDALKFDPDLWQAEYLIGSMLLEKYNRPDAVEAFDKALKMNPDAAEPYVGKGLAALQRFDLKEAEEFANEALHRNKHLPAALRLKADLFVIGGELHEAEKVLKAAVAVNPRDEATLGKLAAVLTVMKRPAEAAKIEKDVSAFDTKPAVFFLELGEGLESRKLYAKAEECYAKAATLRPKLAGPSTSLGMLHLRMGREEEGRKLLDAAFVNDKFNVRVANMRKVMEHLDRYQEIKTQHYLVKFDGTTDRLLAEFVAEYLEEVHVDLKKQFNYEPEGIIPIQIFSRHEMFSGRTVGLPDLHTIGACTGRVIAMASPKAVGVLKPFNWGRVIRHELVHIFNLAQTDYQCPHWLTEGLAVKNEQMKHPFLWTQTLRDAFDENTLFDLDTITLGFVKPKSQARWTLAYCQAHHYVEYLIMRHGEESVAKILKAYADGMDNDAAIKSVCGIEKAAFEAGYKAYLEVVLVPAQGKKRDRDETLGKTLEELETALKESPDDLDIKARMADLLLKKSQNVEARKLADEVLAAKKGHPVAAVVLSRLLQQAGDVEGAQESLTAAVKANPDNAGLLLGLARVHIEGKEFEKAAAVLEKGRKVAPLDGDWLEQLARVYAAMEDTAKLTAVLDEVVAHDPDDLDSRLKLGQTLLDAGDAKKALLYATQAIQIDVTNETAQKLYVDCLEKTNGDAERMKKRFQRKE